MGDGYGVDPQRLQATGEGIDATIAELSSLGLGVAARTGDNFGNLDMSGMQLGHAGLTLAMSEFCGRWSWGVRWLVQQGNEFAQQLGMAAGAYHDMERYGAGVLRDVVGSVGGDPHAGDETFESSSVGAIVDNPPDYSAAAFQQAGDHIGATWSAEATDVVDTLGSRLNAASTIASALTGGQLPTIPDVPR